MSLNLKEDPIYKALLALGKRAKLDAVVITRYPALLNSKEVQRRTGPDATQLEQAECAETIIRDFITNYVKPGTPQDIVLSALGATEQSEEKSIATRQADLFVSSTEFKDVRKEWFEDLTRLLHGFPPQEPPSIATDADTALGFESVAMEPVLSREEQVALSYSFLSLGRDALRLHFATIACLMEHELGERLTISSGAPPCHKLLFHSLREFRNACDYWQTIPKQVRQLFYGDPKPAKVDDILIGALAELMAFWPLAEAQSESGLVLPYAMELALEYGGSLNHEDLYWDAWLPWYEKRQPSHIETLSSDSGAVAAIVILGAGRNDDAAERALLEVRQAVEARFQSSRDKDINGQPFPDYVQSFFLEHLHDWLAQPLSWIVEDM